MKFTIAAALAVLTLACTQVTMPDASEGRVLYQQNCAQCHGADGKGGGSYAPVLEPAPSDLTRLGTGDAFPRASVLSTIDGYHRAELPGEEMPEFGLLLQGETVPVDTGDGVMTPTPRPLAALLVYLESIQE